MLTPQFVLPIAGELVVDMFAGGVLVGRQRRYGKANATEAAKRFIEAVMGAA